LIIISQSEKLARKIFELSGFAYNLQQAKKRFVSQNPS